MQRLGSIQTNVDKTMEWERFLIISKGRNDIQVNITGSEMVAQLSAGVRVRVDSPGVTARIISRIFVYGSFERYIFRPQGCESWYHSI